MEQNYVTVTLCIDISEHMEWVNNEELITEILLLPLKYMAVIFQMVPLK